MSCRLYPIADFDVSTIERRLGSADLTIEPRGSVEFRTPSSNVDPVDKPSLLGSIISVSPLGDIAVVATEKSALVLTAKYNYYNDQQQPQETFKVTSDIFINHEKRGSVTSLLCLPLVFCRRDGTSRDLQENDWTCVAIGFSSGYVNFYDAASNLLFHKQLYNEPVISLRCQSFQPADQKKVQDEYPEEIYVQYKSVLVCISGSILFQLLREKRSHLAKVAADVKEQLKVTPINYKIWKFTKQEAVADCEVVGPSSASLFDHLRCASLLGGFHAKYQASPPKTTQLVACGSNNYVGFHYFFESAPGLTDWTGLFKTALVNPVIFFAKVQIFLQSLCRTVTPFKNLSSELNDTGAFLSNPKKSQKAKRDVVFTDELVSRWFSIPDPEREGKNIVRSPNREYVAVTDDKGRVCLIDSAKGIVMRMFKGYRDAQCGWLAVEDEVPDQTPGSRTRRVVYLLVIYSPRTGRIEVWPVPVGSPICTFAAGKHGRLLYTPHRFVGLNNKTVNWSVHKWMSCVFLSSEGKLLDINVPFHCVLSEGDDKVYACDVFELKKLRRFLRETDSGEEEIAQEVGLVAAELKSTAGMLDCIKLLYTSRNSCPEAVEAAMSVLTDKVSPEREKYATLSSQEKLLLMKSQQLRNLTSLYKFIRKQEELPPEYSSVVGESSVEPDVLCNTLFMSRREVSNLRMRLAMKSKRSTDAVKQEPVVTFKEKHSKSTFTRFLSCFKIGQAKNENDDETRISLTLNLSSGQPPSEKVNFLSYLLFRDVVFGGTDLSKFGEELLCSGISPIDLTVLAILFWLDTDQNSFLDRHLIRFSQVIGIVCQMEAEIKVASDYNDISPWWNKVRDVIMDSTSPLNALTAAFACRSVAIRIECKIDAQYIKSAKLANENWSDSDDSDCEGEKKQKEKAQASEWEAMSADRARWNLLIGLLEDVTILDCILSRNPRSETNNLIGTPLPILLYSKQVISLSKILRAGTGSITKLVARWIASSGIVARSIVDSTDVEWQSFKERAESKKKGDIPAKFLEDLEAADVVLEGKEAFASQGLRILKWHFPFSLSGSVLLMELSMCYFNEWNESFTKSTPAESFVLFSAAMSCLSQLPSVYIRKGVCVVIWNSFIWSRLLECHRFIGNSANMRIKQTRFDSRPEYSDWLLFSTHCLDFVKLFAEVSEICDMVSDLAVDSIFYQHEDLWESNMVDSISPTSTLTSALTFQFCTLRLSLVVQMASVMQMIIELNIYLPSCIKTLFGSNNVLHKVINTIENNFDTSVFECPFSEVLERARFNFLSQVVKTAYKSVSSLPLYTELSPATRKSMETALRWMSRCEELASMWNLDYDELRRYQVCLLYCAGFDSIAEEIVPAVREKRKLASSLINIARQRLALYMEHSPDFAENLSSIEPVLGINAGMPSLESEDVREVGLHKTLHLLRFVVGVNPSNMGIQLLTAVESMNNAQ